MSDANPAEGTFAACRWVAERSDPWPDDPPSALAFHVSKAVGYGVKIAFPHRTPPAASSFAAWAAGLLVHHERALELWNSLESNWPRSPAVDFANKAGSSAVDVALQFTTSISSALGYGRLIAFGGADEHALPIADARFETWRDLTAQELVEKSQPWPASWTGREIQQSHDRLLCSIDHELRESSADPKEETNPPIFLGNGKLQIDDDTLTLTTAEGNVLQTLVKLRSASKEELERASGHPNAPKYLAAICRKHSRLESHITMPGSKGRGGYRTTIVDGRK